MASGKRVGSVLGLLSMGAAVALVAAACLGGTPAPRHAAAHPAVPASARPAVPTSAHPGVPTSARPTVPASGCTATVTLVESWPGGYRGAATISNVTDRPMNDWYIQWILPPEVRLTQAWNGTLMQSGPVAMIHAPVEKPALPAGSTVSDIGFVGAAASPPAFTQITCG
ncbi:cellulose binding domain-containing protein [Streptosporangium sp. NBC_01756]|uniref:cellulose binding domain-containing protein n=1 Tax=Streptosporangium sp. NBC_01756 TaxID=2975950 RepID=UPI002DDC69D4|nr:cellulose binding domain-containing protein [Streptosporangium sp. NBC_01756]WSC88347.1 cellulose-binding domain-containing protein [Streptosporangium sp. NBC_01756]